MNNNRMVGPEMNAQMNERMNEWMNEGTKDQQMILLMNGQ